MRLCFIGYIFRFWLPSFGMFIGPCLFLATQCPFTLLQAPIPPRFLLAMHCLHFSSSGLGMLNAKFKDKVYSIVPTMGIGWWESRWPRSVQSQQKSEWKSGNLVIQILTYWLTEVNQKRSCHILPIATLYPPQKESLSKKKNHSRRDRYLCTWSQSCFNLYHVLDYSII
jgi:hypothetical protein